MGKSFVEKTTCSKVFCSKVKFTIVVYYSNFSLGIISTTTCGHVHCLQEFVAVASIKVGNTDSSRYLVPYPVPKVYGYPSVYSIISATVTMYRSVFYIFNVYK